MKTDPLRIGLDARLVSGMGGGVEQFVIGLASGLSKLTDGDEEYLFLAYADGDEWIRPYLSGPCRILPGPKIALKRWLASRLPVLLKAYQRLRPLWQAKHLPRSDGTIEKAGVDIMHFTFQWAFITDVPSIYHPWDLQHLHLPQFFRSGERSAREKTYRAFCEQARMVSVGSVWSKRDLIRHYGLPEDKIQVVPGAPVLSAYPVPTANDLATTRQKFDLPETFVFYPAQTWAHKNHIGLLEALAILRNRYGLSVPLVSSGHLNDFFPKIEKRARALGLTDQVRFLGFVSPIALQCLYTLCRGMVFPSRFEGWGLPITEAFQAGAPVACSKVTSLPDLAGDAALLFNPDRPAEIAEAIRLLWTDEAFRQVLIERGRKRAACFSWDRTARIFRAHYRRIANRPMTQEDRDLLEAPPLL
jgi:glycosyltransferase involved in cell wall biosynthesis